MVPADRNKKAVLWTVLIFAFGLLTIFCASVATVDAPRAGEFLDPWGSPYRLAVDANYDNHVLLPSERVKSVAVAWSMGPDGIDQHGTHDDIASWK